MPRMLIAIDGSTDAHHATCETARSLGADAEYTLLSVIPPLAADAADEVAELLTAAQEKAAADAGIEADLVIERSASHGHKPGMVICEVAERIGADSIVVGAKGSHSDGGPLVGSVTWHLLHHAPCPVMVVPITA